ncbi:hypothetical protein [Erythrobacter sp. HI0077]|uniref:hypothetical protein n=1 Tax=Erythrobacter sp. HI0077 TaxID=1822252 RepID=UPI0012E91966|nr:hypothetical protein [Erythrobacter sp. HI0077]
MPTPKQPALLLGPSLALLLTACGGDEVKSTPDPVRFERVPLPVAPAGEAVCDGEPCLSDRQVGELLNQVIDVACAMGDRLAWLSDYYLETEERPTCRGPV